MFELARLLFFAAHNENAKKNTLAQMVLSIIIHIQIGEQNAISVVVNPTCSM